MVSYQAKNRDAQTGKRPLAIQTLPGPVSFQSSKLSSLNFRPLISLELPVQQEKFVLNHIERTDDSP